MSDDVVISVRGLGKRYRLGETLRHDTLRDHLTHAVKGLFSGKRGKDTTDGASSPPPAATPSPRVGTDEFWALRDVSFDVKRGEVVGIIGRNGAGKSTLLKILSQITEPTTGEVHLKGRVASLLEVGTGFHQELSGRENIFLNGAILGMTRAEIRRKFDEIVAFAEVEKFIDTPVKRYSSGMYVRLAFAVAAHLEPEILLVDEVLAVGDASFQRRCLGKMGDVARQGRTVLFVSHNMVAVQTLCRRAVCLADGRLVADDSASSVVSDYLRSNTTAGSECHWSDRQTAPGSGAVRLHRLRVVPDGERSARDLTMQTPFRIEVEYWNTVPGRILHITFHVTNEFGVVVFTTGSAAEPGWCLRPYEVGLYRSVCYVPGDLLNCGHHFVTVLIIEEGSRMTWRGDSLLAFEVRDVRERDVGYMGREPGAVQPALRWENTRLEVTLEALREAQCR